MTHLHWKIIPAWLQLKKEVDIRIPGRFLWRERVFKDQSSIALNLLKQSRNALDWTTNTLKELVKETLRSILHSKPDIVINNSRASMGLEIAIPSPNDHERTSDVVISGGKSRFVDEIRIPKAELRSSAELLSELQKSEGGEPCLAQSKTSIQETGAAHDKSPTGNKETCADTLSTTPSQASLFTQRTMPATKRKWKVIPANSSYGGALSIAVSNMVTRMVRHYDQDERQTDAALHWNAIRTVVQKAFAKHGARDCSDQHWVRLIHQGTSKTKDLWGFSTFLGLLPSNSRTLGWNSNRSWVDGVHSDSSQLERVCVSQGLFFQHSIYPWERTGSLWRGKPQRTADCLLHTTSLSWWRSWRRRTPWWLHSSLKGAPPRSLET